MKSMQENAVSADGSDESGPDLAPQFNRGGLLGICWAQPLPDDLIDATALLAARLVLVCVLIGYSTMHLVGASTLSILFTYHLPVLAFAAALSLKRVAIPGWGRDSVTALLAVNRPTPHRLKRSVEGPLVQAYHLTADTIEQWQS